MIKTYIQLHILLFIYSIGAVCSKIASHQDTLSLKFILFYGMVLLILFIYAIIWQQMLKRISLVTAYANKAITVIWGIIWGALFFKEKINIWNIVGALIIMYGIYMVVREDAN